MHIIPAILTTDICILQKQLQVFTHYCNRVHIDIQDGTQTHTRTLSLPTILPYLVTYTSVQFDVHWMSNQPCNAPHISHITYYTKKDVSTYTNGLSCIYMTVPVGAQGQPFDQSLYQRALALAHHNNGEILLDGGINADTVNIVQSATQTINGVIVGSYFTLDLAQFSERFSQLQKSFGQQ